MTGLTPRQLEVVKLVGGEGLTYREAGEELGIEAETVRAHARAVCRLLGRPDGVRTRLFLRFLAEAKPKAGDEESLPVSG